MASSFCAWRSSPTMARRISRPVSWVKPESWMYPMGPAPSANACPAFEEEEAAGPTLDQAAAALAASAVAMGLPVGSRRVASFTSRSRTTDRGRSTSKVRTFSPPDEGLPNGKGLVGSTKGSAGDLARVFSAKLIPRPRLLTSRMKERSSGLGSAAGRFVSRSIVRVTKVSGSPRSWSRTLSADHPRTSSPPTLTILSPTRSPRRNA
mmetsp:Transcript_3868/g.9164  ORF Transcript_3868/g.9164 Transcript_3868/m.9164 type:complete len:207 (-) Transcript_3868:1110-1730(-)